LIGRGTPLNVANASRLPRFGTSNSRRWLPRDLVGRRKDADVSREMHQAVVPALGQIDIGDSAVQPMRRVNGEVCGAVELLVAPDMVEYPTIGERLAGLDLEPDNRHCTPPINALGIFHQSAARARRAGVSRRRGHNLRSRRTTRRGPFLSAALRPRLAKSERLSVELGGKGRNGAL